MAVCIIRLIINESYEGKRGAIGYAVKYFLHGTITRLFCLRSTLHEEKFSQGFSQSI